MPTDIPKAPSLEDVKKLRRAHAPRFRGCATSTITATIETVTPILGGSPKLREVDQIDHIRVPTIRGHLRFWWRALNAHNKNYFYGGVFNPHKLYAAEADIWGRAGDENGGRSKVDVRLVVKQLSGPDTGKIKKDEFYALWPAQSTGAPRLKAGLSFDLTMSMPNDLEPEVRNALLAWVLFGGYGSRTRRGVGSLKLAKYDGPLTAPTTKDAFKILFCHNIFAPAGSCTTTATDTPTLVGASLVIGNSSASADAAWTTALGWLREFRQGPIGGANESARQPGANGRPSISNWPEADMVRRIGGTTDYSHTPRNWLGRAWPRAGFGLPIVGQFQRQARGGGRCTEPGDFELRWHDGKEEHDRLGSPLIVKAMQAGDGFVPCALWLNRSYPKNGKAHVVIKGKSVTDTGAPFDQKYGCPPGIPDFIVKAGKTDLRTAFMDWLKNEKKLTVIAP